MSNKKFYGGALGLGYPSKYGCGFDCPPFSFDINPCDYFLWGFLKDQVHRQQFDTIADLTRCGYRGSKRPHANLTAKFKKKQFCHFILHAQTYLIYFTCFV